VAWRCDATNIASRRAAERIGFTFEGRFRQVMTRKQRNRDTDWLSIIDSEWLWLRVALDAWLTARILMIKGNKSVRWIVLNRQNPRVALSLMRDYFARKTK
jgi:hypothetical protein